ncbi:competence transcription factor [Halobacillus andaensis]|uniref:Competence transcription factor n=1 Tax=Halobacillus andaensis TaxID=1176239 RepID=A0A917B1Y2_HALAA|nr:competence protein ComK [Halobacillus andaensis]MBP2004104.1 competence protein ComK [Halobacillus andaensis]GGF15827.1 competence transcription factor [Halobacillus andaensis]
MDLVYKKEYEVNPRTMALVAGYDDQGQIITEIIESDQCFYLKDWPSKIVDHSCRYFASSLEGRISGTKQVAGFTHKPPIVISQKMSMYFFPIISPKRKECSWIAHKYIRTYKGENDHSTTITFTNGTSINVPVSVGMISNQIQRTAQFRFTLEDRLKYSAPKNDVVAENYA